MAGQAATVFTQTVLQADFLLAFSTEPNAAESHGEVVHGKSKDQESTGMAPTAWKPILPLSKGSKTYSAGFFRDSQRPADPPSRPKFDEQREPFCKMDKMDMAQNAWTPRIGWFSTQTTQFADSAVRTVWAMRNSAGLPWEIPIPPIAGLPHSRPFVKIHTSSPAAALAVLDLQRDTPVWTYAYLNIVYYCPFGY